MSLRGQISRRRLLSGAALGGGLLLAGCERLGETATGTALLDKAEKLTFRVQRSLSERAALAPEFLPHQMSPIFRTNGNVLPASEDYQDHMDENFSEWELVVDGLVGNPLKLGMAAIKAMPVRSQITQHNCVEGWTAIGKWTGVPLGAILTAAQIKPAAKYVVFHCADDFGGTAYYESIDLIDAFHPQTILAYMLNDEAISVGHGAPLRLRVERQLGYKQAKYVMRVELVDSMARFGQGKGGYWEDAIDYEWYAGI